MYEVENETIKKLEPIIHYHSWNAFKSGVVNDYDDALSSAYLGALNAIRKHNPRLSALTTFAWEKIQGQILADAKIWSGYHRHSKRLYFTLEMARNKPDTRYKKQFPYEEIRKKAKKEFKEDEYAVADLILRGYKLKFISKATHHQYVVLREIQNMLGMIIESLL